MSLSSDELNFLIYRYLQESGFVHSAFAFGNESLISKTNINGSDVPPGSLVSFVQKGLQYTEIEAHLNEDGTETKCDEPFTLLVPHHCQVSGGSAATPMEDAEGTQVPETAVTTLQGHTNEVFICAWNPRTSLLASGSGDSTARLWQVPDGPSGPSAAFNTQCVVLEHSTQLEKSKDVTTLDWSSDGTMLATGSYDGHARIWTEQGQLLLTLKRHKGPIFSVKWAKEGGLLLSGSVDKTAVVWDTRRGEVKQQFEYHTRPTLDVDWGGLDTFATCSTDKSIHICRLGEENPIKTFTGHTDEVNAIKWDPTGRLLASCSDDGTAKIWSMAQDTPVHDLREHTKEIYTIKWSPTGPGSINPNKKLLLATASFDTLVKLWDAERGDCYQTLGKHTDPVYSVAFSPNGEFVASGSFDKALHIWSVKDGSLVRTFRGNGGIFEVCWNAAGDKVAACYSNSTVSILDFKM